MMGHSHPSDPTGDWFQDPLGCHNSQKPKALVYNVVERRMQSALRI